MDRKKILFTGFYVLMMGLPIAAAWKIYDRYRERKPVGLELNQKSWAASYTERGLVVPPDGPREGFWGARLGPKRKSAKLGWFEPPVRIPGKVDVDMAGLQHVNTATAPVADLLILGGSVAYGAYASDIDNTYFSRLAKKLAERGLPVRVTVFASGAWTSANELTAFRLYLERTKPDVALFLNALNDLTRFKDFPPERRVADYLRRMGRARDIAMAENIPLAVAFQPFYPDKAVKSELEKGILKNSYDPKLLAEYFPKMKTGMREMVKAGGISWIDCSDALNAETKTTFSDQWHFSDPGHALLAGCLADGLEPLVRQAAASKSSFPRKRESGLGSR